MAQWSRGGYHVQHNDQAWGTAQIELYAGDGAAAHELISGIWPALARSMLLRVQFIRVAMLQLRARCALAAAAGALDPAPFRREALADAKRLEGQGTPWSLASARLVRGVLAQAARDDGRAVELLKDAAARFDATGMALSRGLGPSAARATHRRRRGERRWSAQADAWMKGQEIRRPDRMAEMYAPGFVGLP